tara:strand:- start:31472 stop:32332 length:861 start_codon:yes stop_codon:yes gene_type:complete
MNVLSLFDGMSCGRIALERAGIEVENYYSSEIDKWAIKVADKNYPQDAKNRLGSIVDWDKWDIDWETIDLVIGGSPCQGFSNAGKKKGFDDPRSKLFYDYVDILNHIKSVNPNIKFLLENIRMKQMDIDTISRELNVQPEKINSKFFSAQNRVRLYWFNWEMVDYTDKGVVLKDILPEGFEIYQRRNAEKPKKNQLKSQCLASGQGGDTSDADVVVFNSNSIVKTPYGRISVKDNPNVRLYTAEECEKLQTIPIGYTDNVSNLQRKKMLGNGWTVDVIAHIFGGLK